MRGRSLSTALFCESPFRRPSFSSSSQRGVGREFQILQANCNQNRASIIMKNHFSEASFADEKSKGHRKCESFQAASSIIRQFSRSSGDLKALTLYIPASNMQDILKFPFIWNKIQNKCKREDQQSILHCFTTKYTWDRSEGALSATMDILVFRHLLRNRSRTYIF